LKYDINDLGFYKTMILYANDIIKCL
jgi:hypothetical protein